MAYSVYGDIANEFKDLTISADVRVTPDKVTEYISQTDAMINGMIGNRYIIPVTGTESLKVLKLICIKIVSNRIAKIMEVKTPKDENNQSSVKLLEPTPMEMLEAIADGSLILSDAILRDSQNGVGSYALKHCIPNTFKKGCDQW